MYLLNYDYYDIHALITFFRYKQERFIIYKSAVQEIINCLNEPVQKQFDSNSVRKILQPYYDEKDDMLSWVLVNNKYTANTSIIKNQTAYKILASIFCEMLDTYNDTKRFYLLCDATHNIPLLLADKKNPKKIIKIMIKDYKKQYNSTFLTSELKNL